MENKIIKFFADLFQYKNIKGFEKCLNIIVNNFSDEEIELAVDGICYIEDFDISETLTILINDKIYSKYLSGYNYDDVTISEVLNYLEYFGLWDLIKIDYNGNVNFIKEEHSNMDKFIEKEVKEIIKNW